MCNIKHILFLVLLNVSMFSVNFCIAQEYTHQNIERKIMNSNKTFQVIDHEVTFQNAKDGITLSGTLSVPEISDKPAVVIMIAGMGPQDRDCTQMGTHKLFLVMSQYLATHGIAVLRYDKRGVGKSQGLFSMNLTATDLAQDVVAAIEFLKERGDVNTQKIGLIGSSEGGLISFIVASQSLDVAFMVSMAASVSNDVISHFEMQLKADGATEQFLESERKMRKELFDIINTQSEIDAQISLTALLKSHVDNMSDEQRTEAKKLPFAITGDNYQHMIAMFNSPGYRFYLKTDSLDFISKVKIPVLAINGDLDFFIAAKTALPKIEQGLKMAGNKNFTIKAIPNQNHWFQECKTGALSEYGTIKETINESTLKLISDWISKTAQSLIK